MDDNTARRLANRVLQIYGLKSSARHKLYGDWHGPDPGPCAIRPKQLLFLHQAFELLCLERSLTGDARCREVMVDLVVTSVSHQIPGYRQLLWLMAIPPEYCGPDGFWKASGKTAAELTEI